jgi:hypothetical protein
MFAVAARSLQGASRRGWYRGHVVHFAASTKDDPKDLVWPERFLDKLEGLVLKRMLWLSAKVHFESVFFSERVFLYEVNRESLGGLYGELDLVRFGERVESEVGWARRELKEIGCRPIWLR